MAQAWIPDKKEMEDAAHGHNSLPALVLTAIGIVFGDIGTSPLYTLKTVIALSGGAADPNVALGLLSLITWTLLITVSVKYVIFVMRADNDGEGGILALMSLLKPDKNHQPFIIAIGLFGAALIYGDGVITPAISVLSAVEGLNIAAPEVAPFILPVSILILLTFFALQYHGTKRIGWVFGPIMMVWFMMIGVLGMRGIMQYPAVLAGFSPWYAFHYLLTGGSTGFLVLGGVFLAVTGAEALYADMGHIGARPIRLAWYGLILPSLLLNYAGQTALMLAGYPVGDNIFYRLCPQPLLMPFIVLATLATIIASQAIISGAFSMTRQAIQLGWCPRLNITQTDAGGYGQIYVRAINWLMMTVTIGLTIAFGSSDRLASAYGIAVSLTMLLTTVLLFVVMRRLWKWNLAISLITAGTFFCIDAAFLSANFLKVLEGGWVPLALAAIIYGLMIVWHRGADAVARHIQALAMPLDYFKGYLLNSTVARVPGTAVFLTRTTADTPPIIIWHVVHNRALHHHVVALTVLVRTTPWVAEDQRLTIETLDTGFWRIIAAYGFMEKADIPELLRQAKKRGCNIDLADVTYYVGHETILHAADGTGLPRWQTSLYAFMQRNSTQISEYLSLPRDAVVELNRQIEI